MERAMAEGRERRRHDRFSVEPMYSGVVVRRRDGARAGRPCEGHVYDVGLGGARIELDRPIAKGAPIEIEIDLPGCPAPIAATARVVRVFDRHDDPGPRRIAVAFETFADGSESILARHLAQGWLRRAPAQAETTPAARAEPSMIDAIMAGASSSRRTRSASAA
jgi:hypothetical protein